MQPKNKRLTRLEEYTRLYDMVLDIHHYLEKLEIRLKLLRIEEKFRDETKQGNNKSTKKGKS